MLAVRRLGCGHIFKSKKFKMKGSLELKNCFEHSPKIMCFIRSAHHRNPALPSFKEGSVGSRYFPAPVIEKTEEKIKEILSEKNLQTTEEWEDIKHELFIQFELLSEVNFSSIVMNCLLLLNKVREGHSFMKYLNKANLEPNFLTYLKYMALCGRNIDQCGQELVLQTWKKVKPMIDASPVLDLTRMELIAKGLFMTDQWRVCFDYLKKVPTGPNSAVKNCLAAAAIKNNDETLTFKILTKWMRREEVPNKQVMNQLLLYAQRLHFNQQNSEAFIVKLFEYMQLKGMIVNKETIKFIENYFKCCSSNWEISYAKVSRDGECDFCLKNLKVVDLSNEDFLQLKSQFLERSVKKNDLFINTTTREFEQFIRFIDSRKPFDFVVDGLNTAHTNIGVKNGKTLALHLLQIVQRLSKKSDKILVLGRHHMAEWPKSIMKNIYQKADVFLTSNSSQDDPFTVYAALASGPDSYIVSQDLMRDHIARLEDPKLIWLFKRWQQTHQMYISVKEDRKVKFIEPLMYSINIQGNMNEGWHIPFDDEIMLDPYEELNNWLCVHKKS